MHVAVRAVLSATLAYSFFAPAPPAVAGSKCVTSSQVSAVKVDDYPKKGWTKARVKKEFGFGGKRASRKNYDGLIIEHRHYQKCGEAKGEHASVWFSKQTGEDKHFRATSKFW